MLGESPSTKKLKEQGRPRERGFEIKLQVMANRSVLLVVACVAVSLCLLQGAMAQSGVMSLSYFSDFFNISNNCVFSEDGTPFLDGDFNITQRQLLTTKFRLQSRRDLLININAIVTALGFTTNAPSGRKAATQPLATTTTETSSTTIEAAAQQAATRSEPAVPSRPNYKKTFRSKKGETSFGLLGGGVIVWAEICNADADDPQADGNCLPFAPATNVNAIPPLCFIHNKKPDTLTSSFNCWMGPTQYQPLELNVFADVTNADFLEAQALLVPSTLTYFARNVPKGRWILYLYADQASVVIEDYQLSISGICVGQTVMTVQPTTFTDVL